MPRIARPKPGLTYFWFLNSDCPLDEIRRQIAAFAAAKVNAIVLHPRGGLLVPYGGSDWFAFIKTLVAECVKAGVTPWLYDDDPYPSGSAGGWITLEHPELEAHGIERFEAEPGKAGELFIFPKGRLVWAGAVPPESEAGEPEEFTERVGFIRRHWEVSPWDSRWYYPAAPLYDCPRSEAYYPEFALRRPELKPGWKLVAYVARPVGGSSPWGSIADSLNPAATEQFIQRTHERYAQELGDALGRDIPAIFTDEAKFHAAFPWTPGMFESFREQFGYDLRQRLEQVFGKSQEPRAILARLHYRQWCAQRLLDAWVRPISNWCRDHGLALVGHFSPEDDPIQQVMCVGNAFPIHQYLDLAGLDLIIPAVGDARHAILNVGVLTATSAAQQLEKPGVMSETLGANGVHLDTREAARIIAWQAASGVSHVVIHGAFTSTVGLRQFDAPPDSGPDSPRWAGLQDVNRGLQPFFETVYDSTQIAPVAILWPIRSFQADNVPWEAKDIGRRKELNDLIMACLENQVGLHLIDEDTLISAPLQNGELRVGRARYKHVLLPSMSVIQQKTLERLQELHAGKFPVWGFGSAPKWIETARSLEPAPQPAWQTVPMKDAKRWCRDHLPRLLPLADEDLSDLRATAWDRDGETKFLVVNLGSASRTLRLAPSVSLAAGEIISLRQTSSGFSIGERFDPNSVAPLRSAETRIEMKQWQVRFDEEPWRPVDRPTAVYQLRPQAKDPGELIRMGLTGAVAVGEEPAAKTLEYRATVSVPEPDGSVTLVLEPTTLRGKFTVTVGGRDWPIRISDTDVKPVELQLDGKLKAGENEVRFRLDAPAPFDGIKWSPWIRIGKRIGF